MVIAEWKSEKWQVNNRIIRGIDDISMSVQARTETDKESGEERCIGRTLETLSISFTTMIATGGNPKKENDALQLLVGQSAPFYCGTNQLGSNDFILTNVYMSEASLDNAGNILKATFELSFIEDSSQQELTGTKEDKPNIKIMYQGKDIFSTISLSSLLYTQYAENHADVLEMIFNDTGNNWNRWDNEKMKDTEISVIAEGVETGKMIVFSCTPQNGLFVLKALSVPMNYNSTTTKSWESVTLEDLAKEIAGKYGLGFKNFSTKGKTRKYVSQNNEGDFKFLSKRCELEGACFVVYDGTLNLYDEKSVEAGAGGVEIDIDDEKFTSVNPVEKINRAIGEYIVKNGRFQGKASDNKYTEAKTEIISEPVENEVDCNDIATAFLRKVNKAVFDIEIKTDLQSGVSAGSVIKCKSKKRQTWNGNLFVHKLRHDLVRLKSVIWARKPLDY
jgi:hypothetical protein